MSNSRPFAAVLSVLFALPAILLFAGVDDEWMKLFSQAQYSAAAKQYPKAETLFRQALHEAENFGKDDIRVAATSQGLGETLHIQKKLNEAEEALLRAVDIFAKTPGDGSIEFGRAEFDLAAVLIDEGKYPQTLQSIGLLLPVFENKLSVNDKMFAAAFCMQGNSYRLLKMYSLAVPPLKRCADLLSDDGEVASPEFGEAANSLAIVYQFTSKYALADRYFNYAETIRENTLGILSPQLADTLETHAILLHQLGRDKEAKDKERLAAQIRAHARKK